MALKELTEEQRKFCIEAFQYKLGLERITSFYYSGYYDIHLNYFNKRFTRIELERECDRMAKEGQHKFSNEWFDEDIESISVRDRCNLDLYRKDRDSILDDRSFDSVIFLDFIHVNYKKGSCEP